MDSTKLKDVGKYDEENLIKIEGGTWEAIFNNYFQKIANEGYNMTINEACSYIGCSYTYFITRIIKKIKHIRINMMARKILYKMSSENKGYEDYYPMFGKRILLSREDFYSYVKMQMEVEQQYAVFDINDIQKNTMQEINNNLKIYYENNKRGKQKNVVGLFEEVISSITEKNPPERYNLTEDKVLPSRLYSIKELKEHFGVASEVQVYRIIDKFGAKKYIIFDFVRYDLNDFKADTSSMIKVDYSTFIEMNRKADFLSTITNKVLINSRELTHVGAKRRKKK